METQENVQTVTLETETLATIPPNAKAAVSGMKFEDCNFQHIILQVATRKSANGHTISLISKKGKMSLFSGVAAFCKSQCKIEGMLNEAQVKLLNEQIALFWEIQSKALIEEGYQQVGLRKHIPKVEFDLADKRITSTKWLATQRLEKDGGKETAVIQGMQLREFKKRLMAMEDQPSKYDGKQFAEIKLKIELTEVALAKWEASKQVNK